MKKNYILDCTLRDGGYCNEWRFGKKNIEKILANLGRANIDIVECGYLTEKFETDEDLTQYNSITQIPLDKKGKNGQMYVVMVNYGEYDWENLPYNQNIIDGIRLAFHKENAGKALEACKIIKEKGYKVFIQPMVSLRYSAEEFRVLLEQVNKVVPYAFYIVDSFGSMKGEELADFFGEADSILSKEIKIGFHSHNNLQRAFSNAELLLAIKTSRSLIIDASVYGMGRGAGNLNTELIAYHMKCLEDGEYRIENLLEIIDDVLREFYEEKGWGYSLPNFLSASYNSHPNYAMYLENKKTLTTKEMKEIFEKIPNDKRIEYDEIYIRDLYLDYLRQKGRAEDNVCRLEQLLGGKEILLIAPGKTSETERDKIISLARRKDIVTISVNFDYQYTNVDYIFVSNIRRYKQLNAYSEANIIATSNIKGNNIHYSIQYGDYVNDERGVEDNATLMLIKLLIKVNASKLYIAGLDGYSENEKNNYLDKKLQLKINEEKIDLINTGLSNKITEFSKKISIEYVTQHEKICLEGKNEINDRM